jgi:hypothetical protein
MYLSRLAFHTLPGKTHEVEEGLKSLRDLVTNAGGKGCRILRTHFASLGAPDLLFEQEADDLQALEEEISQVADTADFRRWSEQISTLLREPPKREIYRIQG